MKFFYVFFALFLLSSCSKSDKYIGTWQNAYFKTITLKITKDNSGDGFIIKRVNSNKKDIFNGEDTYTGIIDNNVLKVSIPLIGLEPVLIDDDGLHFNDGHSCKNCDLWKKIN